jgi:hypothetical protein
LYFAKRTRLEGSDELQCNAWLLQFQGKVVSHAQAPV